MTYLVHAPVLGELTRRTPNAHVVAWLRAHEADIVVEPLALGELQHGILLRPQGARRRALERWFAGGASRLPVVPIDAGTTAAWAALLARLRRRGVSMAVTDSLVAATALAHGFTVVTRSTATFEEAGVPVVDPYEEPASLT